MQGNILLLCATVLVLVLTWVEAATYIELNAKNSAYPGMCYSRSFRKPFKFDRAYPMPGGCGRVTCNKQYELDIATCGAIGIDPSCRLSEVDLSLPYPECCPRPICDGPDYATDSPEESEETTTEELAASSHSSASTSSSESTSSSSSTSSSPNQNNQS